MYEKLVKRLRDEAYAPYHTVGVLLQAADAIEELSKRVPPAPHGRLIDADAMRASMPPCFTMEEICKAFKDAPTIIQASEEGET